MAKKYKSDANSAVCGPSPEERAKWQAEDDLRTCTRYYEIKKDPKRMAAVRKLAKEQVASLKQHIGE